MMGVPVKAAAPFAAHVTYHRYKMYICVSTHMHPVHTLTMPGYSHTGVPARVRGWDAPAPRAHVALRTLKSGIEPHCAAGNQHVSLKMWQFSPERGFAAGERPRNAGRPGRGPARLRSPARGASPRHPSSAPGHGPAPRAKGIPWRGRALSVLWV